MSEFSNMDTGENTSEFSSSPASSFPAGTLLVSGAGTELANGYYIPIEESSGKLFYNLLGSPVSPTDFVIIWDGANWNVFGGDKGNDLLYVSSDDVPTPDLVSTWGAVAGMEPLPAVHPV